VSSASPLGTSVQRLEPLSEAALGYGEATGRQERSGQCESEKGLAHGMDAAELGDTGKTTA
jgi:hypothetical protein